MRAKTSKLMAQGEALANSSGYYARTSKEGSLVQITRLPYRFLQGLQRLVAKGLVKTTRCYCAGTSKTSITGRSLVKTPNQLKNRILFSLYEGKKNPDLVTDKVWAIGFQISVKKMTVPDQIYITQKTTKLARGHRDTYASILSSEQKSQLQCSSAGGVS